MEAARTGAPLAVEGATAASRYLLRLASDEKLVGRVRGGSEQAFAVLYERHHRSILSFCRHMLGSRDEAEDAVQQAFANAYRAMLGSERELNVKPWLYRIARNQCISTLRARRADTELGGDEPSLVGLSDQVARRDELRDLLRDLAGLPVDQREALVLAELHDNSHAEVAAIVGCEREKVKSLVFQARSSLIKSREARETPCEEIRRQLSVLQGGALRRNTIRRHLQHCEGCRTFRNEVKRQRRAMAVILPVVPSIALKVGAANAMAAAAIGGGLAAGGSSAAAGPLAALAGKLGVSAVAVKGAAATVAVTVAAGGGAVAVKEVRDPARDQRPNVGAQSGERGNAGTAGGSRLPGGASPSGPAGAGAAVIPEVLADGDDRAARRKARRSGIEKRAGDPAAMHRKAERRAAKLAKPMRLTPAERARRKAERRQAAKERRLERRPRRQAKRRQPVRKKQPVRRKPAPRKPARRRAQPPAGTTPVDPAPTNPPPQPVSGPTFPKR